MMNLKLSKLSGVMFCFALVLTLYGCATNNKDLILAAEAGNVKEVSRLLADGADVNAKGKDDDTPLYAAAYWGHKGVAELLIAKGADVNAVDKGGHTPLAYAIKNEHGSVAKMLRQHGGK